VLAVVERGLHLVAEAVRRLGHDGELRGARETPPARRRALTHGMLASRAPNLAAKLLAVSVVSSRRPEAPHRLVMLAGCGPFAVLELDEPALELELEP
jgi:hypothetical protein